MLFRILWIGFCLLPLDGFKQTPTTVSLLTCWSVRYRTTVYVERGYNCKEPYSLTSYHNEELKSLTRYFWIVSTYCGVFAWLLMLVELRSFRPALDFLAQSAAHPGSRLLSTKCLFRIFLFSLLLAVFRLSCRIRSFLLNHLSSLYLSIENWSTHPLEKRSTTFSTLTSL